MTVLVNRTPHAVATGYGRDGGGRPAVFVSVKATFTWARSGVLTPCGPVPVRLKDEVVGEGLGSAILRSAEVGPTKPKVDVLLAGAIVLPSAVEQIDVTLEVGQRLAKTVRIVGPRRWILGVSHERVPSKARPFNRAPIDWRYAFGGADPRDTHLYEARNPAGCGLGRDLAQYDDMSVPLFEDAAAPIRNWKSRPNPKGFGPVAPHWLPRSSRAGTYDRRWNSDRAPLPPLDLVPAFYNVAPDDQQLPSYVPGEEVRLRHMTINGRDHFALPELDVPVLAATEEALFEAHVVVDTLVIEPEELRLSVIGRWTCPLGGSPLVYEVAVGPVSRAHRRALETGKRYRAKPHREE